MLGSGQGQPQGIKTRSTPGNSAANAETTDVAAGSRKAFPDVACAGPGRYQLRRIRGLAFESFDRETEDLSG
jgi:hypothetical protein